MNDPMRYASDLLRVPVHVYAVKGESGTEIIAGIYVRSSLNGIYLTSRVIDGEVKGKKSLRHVLPDIVIAKDEVLAEIEVG